MLLVWIVVLALVGSAFGDVESSATAGDSQCDGDRNATFVRIPNPCQPTCREPKKTTCDKECSENGCECNEGYVLSPTGKCILSKDCPVKCHKNAVYKKCPNPCPGTCKYPSGPGDCVAACPEYGCECKPGHFLHKGKCILLKKCPGAKKCTRNETFVACGVECPDNFCPKIDIRGEIACDPPYPCKSGCVCKASHLRLGQSKGKCVLASDCPPLKCKRPNEEYNSCPKCLAERCADINKNQTICDTRFSYCRPKCVCKEGFYRNGSDVCVPAKDCVKCQLNAVYKECPNPCQGTCENPSGDRPCTRPCVRHGCECQPGYVLYEGKCILIKECPAAKNCKKNETFVGCKFGCPNNYCPVDDRRAIVICDPVRPCPPGCVCQANHLRLNRTDDTCILASECPPVKCTRPNEIWNSCPKCLAEKCIDIGKNQTACDKPYSYCKPQCVCKEGYYRNGSDICVPAKDCVKCQPNAVYKKCPNPCPGTCEYPSGSRVCNKLCLQYGCECEPGFVLSDGKCISLNECPGAKLCTKNETFVGCKAGCPTNYCPTSDTRAKVACSPPSPCPSGCVCKGNHLRLNRTDDRCILASECPPVKCTRRNEEWNSCPNCLAERCEDIGKNQTNCNKRYGYCEPQCMCKKGFYRNASDICIPAIDCPGQCPIKPECRPTCAVPNPPNCEYTKPPANNVDACQCKEGYVLSEKGGNCTKIEECPDNLGCNSDPNAAVKKCPQPCPSTCDVPDATPCKKMCLPVGCECKPGFISSKIGGKCIQPDSCKGGNPCGPNGTFVQCRSNCPNDYCPVDDSRGILICEYPPFSPCYSGCICKINHKRMSREDRRCITSSDCSPVKCTRQNEVWDSCPSDCLAETCKDVDAKKHPCYTLLLNCQPRCVCTKNHYRNASDICISAKECRSNPPPPKCGFNEVWSNCKVVCPPQTCESIFTSYDCTNNTKCEGGCDCLDQHLRNDSGICVPGEQCFGLSSDTCPIAKECRPTCAVPNPPNCNVTELPVNNTDGCQCKSGYILSNADGPCVRVDECPQDQGCNDDPHAVVKSCPWPCPATCDSPNTKPCRKACLLGCQCSPGYILSEDNGKCILPEECHCGNPCGVNGTFSDCGFRCPNQYCPQDDSLVRYACKPGRPCPPGCQCNENNKRISYEDDTCVISTDCPPITCTRDNEEYNPCVQCLAERCEDINRPVLCGDPPGTNCDQRCVCVNGYYRDENDNCVPKKECKKQLAIDS